MAGLLLWLLAFFFMLALLCIIGYQLNFTDIIILLVDLEFDYINPYDSASRINRVILKEFIIQGIFCFFLLVSGHWVMFLVSLPCLYYNIRLYITKQYLVDVTEIYKNLTWEKKRRFYKAGYLVMLFPLSLFWLIWSITEMEGKMIN